MGKTKKETDFWGNEKEVHYNDSGEKTGETRFKDTLFSGKVQEHFDTSGNKTGETRKESGFFGDKAVHTDTSGNKTGHTKDDTTIFGNPIQRHFDETGKQVGKSTYETTVFGSHYKKHSGDFFKSHSPQTGEGSGDYPGADGSGSGYSGSVSSSHGGSGKIFFVIVVAILLLWGLFNSSTNNRSTSPAPQYQPPAQTPSVAETPRPSPTPAPEPAPQVRMTRILNIPIQRNVPPGTRIDIWTLENGVKTKKLQIARWNLNNRMLYVTLAEEISETTKLSVDWFLPRPTVTSRPMYVAPQRPMYAPRQYKPYRNYRH